MCAMQDCLYPANIWVLKAHFAGYAIRETSSRQLRLWLRDLQTPVDVNFLLTRLWIANCLALYTQCAVTMLEQCCLLFSALAQQ